MRLYHFLARTYSCHVGRWLERDPIGYRDDINLYAYTASSPVRFVDPLGLELCFGPLTPKTKERIMEQIKKQCPQATLDGNCIKLEEPKPEDKCPDSQPSSQPTPPPSNPKACEILRTLINSKTKYTIKTGQDKKYSPKEKVITHCVNCPIPYKIEDGKTRPSYPWEGLWHEMIHAYHDDMGTNTGDGQEEVNTINETSELLDWYNQNNPEEEPDRAPRDPYSHGKSQHLDPDKGKGKRP